LPKEKAVEIFFGRYEMAIERRGDDFLFRKFKVILLNDYLPAKIDFYSL
jgi:hypothetical protein